MMSPNSLILISEGHTIMREGLRSLLSSVPGLEIVGEAKNGGETVQLVENLKPDHVPKVAVAATDLTPYAPS
jgi:DNA-binding NarL/FixJ family response regulator